MLWRICLCLVSEYMHRTMRDWTYSGTANVCRLCQPHHQLLCTSTLPIVSFANIQAKQTLVPILRGWGGGVGSSDCNRLNGCLSLYTIGMAYILYLCSHTNRDPYQKSPRTHIVRRRVLWAYCGWLTSISERIERACDEWQDNRMCVKVWQNTHTCTYLILNCLNALSYCNTYLYIYICFRYIGSLLALARSRSLEILHKSKANSHSLLSPSSKHCSWFTDDSSSVSDVQILFL